MGKMEQVQRTWRQEPRNFVLSLCTFVLLQGAVITGYLPGVLSTLETRFNFESEFSGIIMTGYDVAALIFLLPISYTHHTHAIGRSYNVTDRFLRRFLPILV